MFSYGHLKHPTMKPTLTADTAISEITSKLKQELNAHQENHNITTQLLDELRAAIQEIQRYDSN